MKASRILFFIVITIFIIFVGYYAFFPYKAPEWTGFGPHDEKIPRAKTLWDWLEIIIIPATIAIVGGIIKEAEKEKNIKENKEKLQLNNIDNYYKIISELLTRNNLLELNADDSNWTIARARTILALEQADNERKGQILQFLYESKLLQSPIIINLTGANFKNSELDGIVFRRAEIKGAYFNNSLIRNAFLDESNLTGCDLSGVDFSGSSLSNCNMSYANLTGAKLVKLDLTTVDFEGCNLTNCDIRESKILKSQLDSIYKKEGIKYNNKNLIY